MDPLCHPENKKSVTWIDLSGNPAEANGITANVHKAARVERGEVCGSLADLVFRDPDNFKAGELHENYLYWEEIARRSPFSRQDEVLTWIREKVSLEAFFRHFNGQFKGRNYNSDRPPANTFRNNVSCKPFRRFVQSTLINRVKCGAISVVGKVGVVNPPHIVLPLTVEPTKPRLCHDARYLNLWMCDMPFTLDTIVNLPRYVRKDGYQTVLDDKSGYDHILLTEKSRTFFGIQWGGWYFTYNTLPFGWKISPYVYHTTGLLASNFFRSIRIPCSLYIDDRHNGELQISLDQGEYHSLPNDDVRHRAAAESAVFLVAYHLVRLGYFLGLAKSFLVPQKVVPYLGFLSDSEREVFHLKPEKKANFILFLNEILAHPFIRVKTLQRLAGKCVSFSLAVPAAKLFTREMNRAISTGLMRPDKSVPLTGKLREEVSHWLFLEQWDDPLPWREERHFSIAIATNASNSGWGGHVIAPFKSEVSDYWLGEECQWDIATKEAVAIDKVLNSFAEQFRNARVDAQVDNKVVVSAWNNNSGRSSQLNGALKTLFFTTSRLNVLLHLSYIPSAENPADAPSRYLSAADSKLSDDLWSYVQKEFGGEVGHSVDLMSLDSNAMRDKSGKSLPHFTPFNSPDSSGVNLFAQDLSKHEAIMSRPYVFPPLVLVGPLLRFMERSRIPFTLIVLDIYPRRYWWAIIIGKARKTQKLASVGDVGPLVMPTQNGWVQDRPIAGDLWAFAVNP